MPACDPDETILVSFFWFSLLDGTDIGLALPPIPDKRTNHGEWWVTDRVNVSRMPPDGRATRRATSRIRA